MYPCGTEFDADFNYTSAGKEARNREAYIERHTEGVPIAGEVLKIWKNKENKYIPGVYSIAIKVYIVVPGDPRRFDFGRVPR